MTRNGTSTDSVRVTNWFTVAGNQLDFVQFTDQTLTNTQINSLLGFSGLQSQSLLAADPLEHSTLQFVDAMNHFVTDTMVMDPAETLGNTEAHALFVAAAPARTREGGIRPRYELETMI